MPALDDIQALFFDIGGTLHVNRVWIPGAREAVQALRGRGLKARFLSNLTQFSRRQVHELLREGGLEVPAEWIFTPARAASAWLKENLEPGARVLGLVRGNLKEDLGGLNLVSEPPAAALLLGDMGPEWSLEGMNQGLRALVGGARLFGMERNRFYRLQDGLHLDSGPFLAALEYASGRGAEAVFGKPNPALFRAALADARVEPGRTLMVGDDLESDVLAALKLGMKAALVRTGKFQPGWEEEARRAGALVLGSVADLAG